MRVLPKTGTRVGVTRRGGVIVWVVLSLSALVAVVALTFDGGRVFEERRRVQAATDAAALAAAGEVYEASFVEDSGLSGILGLLDRLVKLSWQKRQKSSSIRDAALKIAARYGYTNDGINSVVKVNYPPASGPFAGDNEFVEVIITSYIDNTFGRVLTRDKLVVESRAVARGRPKKLGILTLNGTNPDSLKVTNNGTVRVRGASIRVNSRSPSGYNYAGNGSIEADSHETAGTIQQSGGIIVGPKRTGAAPTPDPLKGIPPPNPLTLPLRGLLKVNVGGSTTRTLQPGTYLGGISVSGNSDVTLQPGIYHLGTGGLSVDQNAVLRGSDVLIFNPATLLILGGDVSFGGDSTVALRARDSGTYAGILIYQSFYNKKPLSISGKASVQLEGVVYAPGARADVSSSAVVGSLHAGGAFVVDTMAISGDGSVEVSMGVNGPAVPDIGLVE
jgi:hypothetical protein